MNKDDNKLVYLFDNKKNEENKKELDEMFIIRKAIIKAMKNIESEVSPHNIIKVLGFYLCEITFKHCPDPFVATNLLLQILVNQTEAESLKIIKRDV
jgi:hypothetical protein|tara:strand:- start:322 stop:612 length:291 start_codon:yes stop_codon:yes gene_type:complete